jgi:hypothetical protein
MDFDPRDDDSREEERLARTGQRANRDGSHDDRESNDWRQPEIASRHRDDDGRDIGRGAGDDSRQSKSERLDAREDARCPKRDRDPRDTFTRDLKLPRGRERETVRDREYALRGSESRTLATVGAFRVVSSRDLRDHHDAPANPRSGDLRHLREQASSRRLACQVRATMRCR